MTQKQTAEMNRGAQSAIIAIVVLLAMGVGAVVMSPAGASPDADATFEATNVTVDEHESTVYAKPSLTVTWKNGTPGLISVTTYVDGETVGSKFRGVNASGTSGSTTVELQQLALMSNDSAVDAPLNLTEGQHNLTVSVTLTQPEDGQVIEDSELVGVLASDTVSDTFTVDVAENTTTTPDNTTPANTTMVISGMANTSAA